MICNSLDTCECIFCKTKCLTVPLKNTGIRLSIFLRNFSFRVSYEQQLSFSFSFVSSVFSFFLHSGCSSNNMTEKESQAAVEKETATAHESNVPENGMDETGKTKTSDKDADKKEADDKKEANEADDKEADDKEADEAEDKEADDNGSEREEDSQLDSIPCALWYYSPKNSSVTFKTFNTMLRKLDVIRNVSHFWSVYEKLPLLKSLDYRDCFHFFKEGVEPKWEDERHIHGGNLNFKLPKYLAQQVWMYMMVNVIADAFHVGSDVLTGSTCKGGVGIKNEVILQLWNTDARNKDQLEEFVVNDIIKANHLTNIETSKIRFFYRVSFDEIAHNK